MFLFIVSFLGRDEISGETAKMAFIGMTRRMTKEDIGIHEEIEMTTR